MTPRIKTHHEFPPIPDRRFDWVAYYDGQEECGPYGYGPTEEEAVKDLKAAYWQRVSPHERLQKFRWTSKALSDPRDNEAADIRYRADMIDAGRGHLLR